MIINFQCNVLYIGAFKMPSIYILMFDLLCLMINEEGFDLLSNIDWFSVLIFIFKNWFFIQVAMWKVIVSAQDQRTR